MEFSRLEYWCGLPFPPPGELPNPGIEPESPPLAGRFFTTEPSGKPRLPTSTNNTGCLLCAKHIITLSSHPSFKVGAIGMSVLQIQNWDLNKSSDLLQVPRGKRGRNWTSPTSMWFQSYIATKQIILLFQQVSQSLTSSFWASSRQDLCHQIFPSGSACLGTGYSGCQSQKDWNQQGR